MRNEDSNAHAALVLVRTRAVRRCPRRDAHAPAKCPRSAVRCASILALALAACGDHSDAPDRPAPTDGSSSSIDAGVPSEYEANGIIVGGRPDAGPIAGARVCVPTEEGLPCAFSDWTGTYRIRLPVHTNRKELAVHVAAPDHIGFVGTLRAAPMFIPGEGWLSASWLPTIPLMEVGQLVELMREGNITPRSPNHALVRVQVLQRGGGAPVNERVTLIPGHPAKAVYMSAARKYDSSLAALTESGLVMFYDVPPGRFEVTVSHCHPVQDLATNWSGSTPDAIAGLAVSGAVTDVPVSCSLDQ